MDESSSPLVVEVDRSRNLNDLFAERVAATPDRVLMERRSPDGGPWATTTALQLDAEITAVARGLGAKADRGAIQEVQVAISARPDQVDLPFWRAVLGYAPLSDDNGIDPLGMGSTVWMQELDPQKPLKHAMHIDVSVAREEAEARVAAAVAAGGRVVTDAEAPAAWILADRAGNKVCIAAWPDGAPGLADD